MEMPVRCKNLAQIKISAPQNKFAAPECTAFQYVHGYTRFRAQLLFNIKNGPHYSSTKPFILSSALMAVYETRGNLLTGVSPPPLTVGGNMPPFSSSVFHLRRRDS